MHKLKKYLSYYLHQMDIYLLLANYIYIFFCNSTMFTFTTPYVSTLSDYIYPYFWFNSIEHLYSFLLLFLYLIPFAKNKFLFFLACYENPINFLNY